MAIPMTDFVTAFFLSVGSRIERYHTRHAGGVAALHTKALDHVVRIVLLIDCPFFAVTGDVNAENSHYATHVRHLESIHHEQKLVSTQQKEVVNVAGQYNKADRVDVNLHARFRLGRPKTDVAEALIHRAKPTLGALAKSVKAFLTFHY